MPKSKNLEETIVDNVKFGAVEVINKALRETLDAGTDPEAWSVTDKGKYFLILEVQDSVLRRINRVFAVRRRKRKVE